MKFNKKYIKKIFKWLIYSVLLFVFLLFSASFIINKYYKDEIISVALSSLNNNLKTKITLKSYEISLIKKFPDASIEFKNVFAESTKDFSENIKKTDTLFTAKSIFLQFSLIDIFKKQYKIKAIHIDGADVQMKINKKGIDNFHFWKSNENKNTSNFKLELKKITITNTRFHYINNIKDVDIKLYTKWYFLKGNFSEKTYALYSSGKIDVNKLNIDKVEYANVSGISLKTGVNINNNKIVVKNGELSANNLKFNINGTIDLKETTVLDLKLSGNNIAVKNLITALPGNVKNNINDFESDGLFYFNGTIKGEISNKKTPLIKADFGINNGSLINKQVNIKLDNIKLTGNWTNAENGKINNTALVLDNLYAKFKNSEISGKYEIHNFKHPHIIINGKINGDLPELVSFFEIDTIENISGNIISEFSFNAKFRSFKDIKKQDILNSKTSGYAKIDNLDLQLKGSSTKIKNLNTGMRFTSKNIIIDSLNFTQNKNDFHIKGHLYNILPFLIIDDKNLKLTGTFNSDNFDTDDFINTLKTNKKERNENSINLNDYITYSLTYNIKKFKYKTFTGENFRGKLQFKNKKLTLTQTSINTLDGTFKGNFQLSRIDSNLYRVSASPILNNININKLFVVFDNFGQNFLQAKNLKGTLSSRSRISFDMNKNTKINQKSIEVIADIKIENGELINFEPMKKLSRFIELSELEDIKFSTIQNQIKISEETIYVPQMEIKSSAFSIGISGTHTFSGNIDYKLRILLSDFLSNKARKAKRENSEFGVIEDDGLGRTSLYLSVKGTTKDFKIKYDTKGVKQHIKEETKKEKTNLKSILNDEFGWFKNDSTLKKEKEKRKKEEKKKKKNKIRIEWEDR